MQITVDSPRESRLKWSSPAGVRGNEKLYSAVILSAAQNPRRLLPAALPSTRSSGLSAAATQRPIPTCIFLVRHRPVKAHAPNSPPACIWRADLLERRTAANIPYQATSGVVRCHYKRVAVHPVIA